MQTLVRQARRVTPGFAQTSERRLVEHQPERRRARRITRPSTIKAQMLDSARSKSADALRRAADRACTSAAPGVLALSAAGDARDVWPLYLRPASLAPINSFSARRLPRTWAVTAARPGCTPSPTFGCSCVGAPTRTSTQSPRPGSTLSGRFAGCRTCAVTSRPAVGQRQRLRPRRAPRLARIASGRCWVATRGARGSTAKMSTLSRVERRGAFLRVQEVCRGPSSAATSSVGDHGT